MTNGIGNVFTTRVKYFFKRTNVEFAGSNAYILRIRFYNFQLSIVMIGRELQFVKYLVVSSCIIFLTLIVLF